MDTTQVVMVIFLLLISGLLFLITCCTLYVIFILLKAVEKSDKNVEAVVGALDSFAQSNRTDAEALRRWIKEAVSAAQGM